MRAPLLKTTKPALGNDPPPKRNDDAAVQAVTGVFKAGLEDLKKLAEGR